MRGKRWTLESQAMNEFVRAILGIALFTLVMGVWVHLWVPSSPTL